MADWNERYRSGDFASLEINPLLARAVEDLEPGAALDLACGAGRHALFLSAHGWQVTAVDSSTAGIELAESRAAESGQEIETILADLEHGEFEFVSDRYDLICDFYFLVRPMFAEIKRALKPGGTFVAAIHLAEEPSGDQPVKDSFALKPGQLRAVFDDWEVLYYHETAGIDADAGRHHKRTAELIARRPLLNLASK